MATLKVQYNTPDPSGVSPPCIKPNFMAAHQVGPGEKIPTKAINKGHLGKGMQQLYGNIPWMDVHGNEPVHVSQLASLYPLHCQHPLPRQLQQHLSHS